jgi:hypothetical protein
MMGRWLMWLLLIYVTLDFSNPLMPGAVNFDADDSVDGVHGERVRPDRYETVAVPAPLLFASATPDSDQVPRLLPEPRARDRELPAVRRDLRRPPDPASPADDH